MTISETYTGHVGRLKSIVVVPEESNHKRINSDYYHRDHHHHHQEKKNLRIKWDEEQHVSSRSRTQSRRERDNRKRFKSTTPPELLLVQEHDEKQPIQKRKKNTNSNNQWTTQLPQDLMLFIFGKLFIADQARFRAVCTTWALRNNHHFPPPAQQLPLLFYWHRQNPLFRLFDPIHGKTYHIKDTSLCNGSYSQALDVWASKQGWLLFSEWGLCDVTKMTCTFFFYNPFTKSLIRLPRQYVYYSISTIECATFSSLPTSPDSCTVFILCWNYSNTTVYFLTCSPGHKTWTKAATFSYTPHVLPVLFRKDNIYLDGVFYCLIHPEPYLAAFNIMDPSTPPTLIPLPRGCYQYYSFLVESGGQLLFVCLWLSDSLPPHSCSLVDIFKLVDPQSPLTCHWVNLNTLGNRALILNDHQVPFSIQVSDTAGATGGGIQANGIYYVNFIGFKFFSLNQDGATLMDLSNTFHPTPPPPFGLNPPTKIFWVQPPTLQ